MVLHTTGIQALSHGRHERSLTRLACTLFNTAVVHAPEVYAPQTKILEGLTKDEIIIEMQIFEAFFNGS
jgi:hypothetical protein